MERKDVGLEDLEADEMYGSENDAADDNNFD